jgi:hypothetical protein
MSPTYTYLDNILDQLSDIPTDSIISRTVYSDPQVKTILFAFAAGQVLATGQSLLCAGRSRFDPG